MKKIQQFWIMSFQEERLRNAQYDLTLSFRDAEKNEEIVSLADNECLRAIRRITDHPYSEERLAELLLQRRRIQRRKKSLNNLAEMRGINSEIQDQLFIPDFVCVQSAKRSQYRNIGKKGFLLNGEKYIRLMCGAGHARTNRAMFVKERIYKKLDTFLRCGCRDESIIWAKWNAYYALSSSATYQVSAPRVCVVPDKEIEMEKLVDFVTPDTPQDKIELVRKQCKFNLWDGMGLISPELAQRWADELEVEYLPSCYVLRNAFIKGLVCTFDFHAFAAEVANSYSITDIYGKQYDIRDLDLIITESMFKLHGFYQSWEEYCEKNAALGWSWGVAKVFDKWTEMKTHFRSNYQFLQVLTMTDEQIAGLCAPTSEWLNGVVGKADKMRMYLLGKVANYECACVEKFDRISDNFVKALLIDEDMAQDDYIKTRIANSISKKIRDACMGRLIIQGTYQPIMADPYGLCEHIFGLPIKGLIPEGECYNHYYLSRGDKHVCALRSPMTWRSEVNGLTLHSSSAAEKWYKYITNGQIQSLWGVDNMLQSGSDFDGDCVFITANEYFWDCKSGTGIPVTYDPEKAVKQKIEPKKLYKTDLLAFDPLIGYITNVSTTLYEIQSQYPTDGAEYKECETRLKLCCTLQSKGIDAAKGIAFEGVPKHWIRKSDENSCLDNEIAIGKRRPYFMRYVYPHKNAEYNKFKRDVDRMSVLAFGVKYAELEGKRAENCDYTPKNECKKVRIMDFIRKNNPLLETSGTMNRICRYMERELSGIRRASKQPSEVNLLKKMFDTEVGTDLTQLPLLREYYEQYTAFKKAKAIEESDYNTYEQYFSSVNRRAYEEISNNSAELANLALYLCYGETKPCAKSFAWDCFGAEILQNIMNNARKNLQNGKISAVMPMQDAEGEIEYMGKRYTMQTFDLEPTERPLTCQI